MIEVLAKTGDYDLNELDDEGEHLLHSIMSKYLFPYNFRCADLAFECLEFLIKRPTIDVNARDRNHRTLLHLAIAYREDEVVDLLAASEFLDVNLKNHDGHTALSLAIELDACRLQRKLINTGKVNLRLVKDSILKQSQCEEVQQAREAFIRYKAVAEQIALRESWNVYA